MDFYKYLVPFPSIVTQLVWDVAIIGILLGDDLDEKSYLQFSDIEKNLIS